MRDLEVGLHAVRGSLAVIRGQCFSVSRAGEAGAVAEGARLIDAEVDRILREIERLAGRRPPTESPSRRIRAVAADVVVRHLAAAEAADVSLRLRDGEGDPLLRGDPDRLRCALDNLVQNAIRHSPADGEVVMAVTASRHGARLTVRNDGDVPTAEELRSIFVAGERGSRPRGPGWGLGLAIATRELAACGGSLAARSAEGGCIFEIELPVGAP